MRQTTLCLICLLILVVSTCSCNSGSDYDFEYDINDYNSFSDIMDNKSEEEWEKLEDNTMLIKGFDTPIVLKMNGMTVITVTAFDKTIDTNISSYQGYSPVAIEGVKDVVVVREDLDYSSRSWIITKDNIFSFMPKDSISTRVFVGKDGNLEYTRFWGEYMTSFNQWDTAPLDLCKSRDEFLYQRGTVRIENGKIFLSPEETVTVSDEYDLDAMFEDAKKNGMYEEYNSADEVLKDNANFK